MGTKKMMVYKRRLEVKKLFLMGKSIADISTDLKVSDKVVRNDITEINRWYTAAVKNNPHILENRNALQACLAVPLPHISGLIFQS